MIMKRIGVVIIWIMLAHCSGEQSQAILPTEKTIELDIVKKRSFNLSNGKILIGRLESPMFIKEIDGEKKYLFYDSGLNNIIISDTTGLIKTNFGGVGSGPNEFRHITSFGTAEDHVIVYDASLDVVKKFDFEGILIDSYLGLLEDKLWVRSNRLYEYNSKLIIGVQESEKSSSKNHWDSKTIALYDLKGNFQSLMGKYDPTLIGSGLLYNYANIVFDTKEGMIYTVHRTSPYIQKFDIESGELVHRFGFISDNFRISDERPNAGDPRVVKNKINIQFSFVGDPFITKDYFLFYFFSFTEEAFELRDQNALINFLQVFKKNGEYVGDIELPFYPLGANENNEIFLLEIDSSSSIKIGVYEFTIQ